MSQRIMAKLYVLMQAEVYIIAIYIALNFIPY